MYIFVNCNLILVGTTIGVLLGIYMIGNYIIFQSQAIQIYKFMLILWVKTNVFNFLL